MAIPSWIRKTLELRGIPIEEIHHRDTFTAQELAECAHISGPRVAKVVVVMVDGRPVELILPASRLVNLKRVRAELGAGRGADVRLATEDEMVKFFTDCDVGAIPALRHWQDILVLLDRSLNVEGPIVFQAGTHADAIRLSFGDWHALVNPQLASFSESNEVAYA